MTSVPGCGIKTAGWRILSAHFFSKEQIHFVNALDGRVHGRLQCKRCFRKLPESQFVSLARFNRSYDLGAGRGALSRQYAIPIHPYCQGCRAQERGKWTAHELYTPELDRFWSKRFSSLLAGAKSRNILVGIDKDDCLGLYLHQDAQCALSGVPLDYRAIGGGALRANRALFAPSVDRIDSAGNYVINNVQIVANIVNVMKSTLTTADFLKWCALIVRHTGQKQVKKEDDLLAAIESGT